MAIENCHPDISYFSLVVFSFDYCHPYLRAILAGYVGVYFTVRPVRKYVVGTTTETLRYPSQEFMVKR